MLFEVAWTLRSAYGVRGEKILEVLRAIATLSGLTLSDSDRVDRALSLAAEHGGDFADAYICAEAQALEAEVVATFNVKDFSRLGTKVYEFPAVAGP